MNTKSLLITTVVAFILVFFTDFLIHGVWLAPVYAATHQLWRPESEMKGFMPWLAAGQFLSAATFAVLWAVGFAQKAKLSCSLKYGVTMGLFFQSSTLINYAVSPLTPEIAAKWFISGVLQCALLGVVVFFVYKPKAE
ncbi:MAG: hypothetical protein JWO89_1924 [Verrucomicrobiaceae bacterium]|nr:hypothetical protein [Verrucomicrobiaceae bacterium]MDB6120794.1 hypothetical protein [Verrucomicrobiaceae bacterium]